MTKEEVEIFSKKACNKIREVFDKAIKTHPGVNPRNFKDPKDVLDFSNDETVKAEFLSEWTWYMQGVLDSTGTNSAIQSGATKEEILKNYPFDISDPAGKFYGEHDVLNAMDVYTSSLQKALEERDKEIESLKSIIAESIELLDEVNDLRKKLEKRIEDLNVDIQEKHDLTVSQSSLIESLDPVIKACEKFNVSPENIANGYAQGLKLIVENFNYETLIESIAGALEDLKDDKFSNREAIPRNEKIDKALNLYYNYKNKENGHKPA